MERTGSSHRVGWPGRVHDRSRTRDGAAGWGRGAEPLRTARRLAEPGRLPTREQKGHGNSRQLSWGQGLSVGHGRHFDGSLGFPPRVLGSGLASAAITRPGGLPIPS